MSSVQRQLNLYGFKCFNRGENKGAFFHPSFIRGNWEEAKSISRANPSKKCNLPNFPKKGIKRPISDLDDDNMLKKNSIGELDDFNSVGDSTSHNSSALKTVTFGNIEDDLQTNYFNDQLFDINTSSAFYPNGVYVNNAVPLEPQKPYINVVNDSVMIDPDFDLDQDLDFFGDSLFPLFNSSQILPIASTIENQYNQVPQESSFKVPQIPQISNNFKDVKKETAEIGVNTDLTQAAGFFDLYQLYQPCGFMTYI